MKYLSQLKDKKVVILGAGLTGLSCARFLHHHNIAFSINDSRAHSLDKVKTQRFIVENHCSVGTWDTELISSAELILASPGIDLATHEIAQAINENCEVFGDVELYCRLTHTPIIAVTGSNGKSTVVSLLEHVGKQLGKNVALGGNVGVPVLDRLISSDDTAEKVELLIAELSSFQLETLTSMNALGACVLNVSDDHLDRHKTLENYAAIKQGIYQQCQTAVYNRDDELTFVPPALGKTLKQISFGISKPKENEFGITQIDGESYLAKGTGEQVQALAKVSQLPLAGLHNAMNYLVVCALSETVNWPLKDVVSAFASFSGLAHRCQRIETEDGITWINDSKATNVGATQAALDGLLPTLSAEQNMILIAGGDGKGADFSPLASLLASVKQVIALGKDGQEIAQLSTESCYVESLQAAVEKAKSLATAGDIVLLSPACASIDMFSNFAQRGEQFVAAVKGKNNNIIDENRQNKEAC